MISLYIDAFRKSKYSLIAILFSVLAVSNSDASLLPDLLQQFYPLQGKKMFCSVARMDKIYQVDNNFHVSLKVEASTRNTLLRLTESERKDWMGLHCPPVTHQFWRSQKGSKKISDTLIEVEGGAEQLIVSCLNYVVLPERFRLNSVKDKGKSILEKLKRKLNDD